MTIQVSIHEAKTHLSRLIQSALDGEEIVIAKGAKPLVKLVALPEARHARHLGGAPELVEFMAEDFDAPLPEFGEYMP